MTARVATIGILSGNHLCRNPRVQKEASALARAGFDVEILGAWTDPRLKSEDLELLQGGQVRFTPVVDATGPGAGNRIRWLAARVRTAIARRWPKVVPSGSGWRLGPAADALWSAAMKRSADLWIAHSEPALWAAGRLFEAGRRVGVDMEDWFSEDLSPGSSNEEVAALLARLERRVLVHGAHSTCPSGAMGTALVRAYGGSAPAVVYNAFPWKDRLSLDGLTKDRADRRRPSIHWYSQTLGPGRGLEELLDALPFVRCEAELHLRGQPAGGFDAWLRERLPEGWRDRARFHSLVPNGELLSRIAEHDVGFAGERKSPRSRALTVTNKILHYLLGGLAVVASDTCGQVEVAALVPEAVQTYQAGDARSLGGALESLLGAPERLAAAKAAALVAAERVFCWERQEPALLRSVGAALPAEGSQN